MAKMKFELNRRGVRDLLTSGEMRGAIESEAAAMQARAGQGYSIRYGRNRVVAFVETGTDDAVLDNLENNTLRKAVRN